MNIPYILTGKSVTFLIGSQSHQVSRDSIMFENVKAELAKTDPDPTVLIELAKPVTKIVREINAAIATLPAQSNYLAKQTVAVTRNGVTLDGVVMGGVLVDRIMETLQAGMPLGGLIRFMENLYMNPSETARDELYLWIEASDLPITEDGHFLAYKKVNAEFKDGYTGTFDNSPGQIVQLAGRHDVDPIRDNLCSRGLHFCSKSYLPEFGVGRADKVVLVKINPADVVSIPSDYGNAKGRTWRYEVLREILEDSISTHVWAPLAAEDGTDFIPETETNKTEYSDIYGNNTMISNKPDDDGEYHWYVDTNYDYAEGYSGSFCQAQQEALEASADFIPEDEYEDEDEDDRDDGGYRLNFPLA